MSDTLELIEPAPNGYYWWVSIGDPIDSLVDGAIYFTPQIHTDNKSGNFFIDYILGHDSTSTPIQCRSSNHPISVNAPMAVTVTNTNDSGEGSLRNALSSVSSRGEIFFDLTYPATVVLDSQLVIDRKLTITGPESGKLTISGNNKARVFYVGNGENVSISNLTIADGNEYANGDQWDASNGGGIFCNNSDLNLKNVTIINNIAADGGGISCGESDVILNNVSISMNKACGRLRNGIEPIDGNGGGLYCSSSNISLTNVRINGNTARNLGGGIIFADSSEILFDKQSRCNIYNNNAVLGNELYNDKNSIINVVLDTFTVLYPTSYYAYHPRDFNFEILNAKITQYDTDVYVKVDGDNNNKGTSWSDAFKSISFAFSRIMADSLHPHTVFINDGIYSPSTTGDSFPLRIPDYVILSGSSRENVILDAEQQGAVIQIFMGNYGSSPPPKNYKQTNFIENISITGGNACGIQCWESILELNNVKIENNQTQNRGGGIYCKYSILNSTNSIIINNTAENGGGGIRSDNSDVSLNKVLISSNSATSDYTNHGGGISCRGSLNMTDVRIIGNSGAYYGGGIHNRGEIYLFGVTIAENVALNGGGICFSLNAGAYFDPENRCNIYSNIGAQQGDDLYHGYDDTTKIAVIVDTFTVLNPTEVDAYPLWKYDFDILHDASGATDINAKNVNLPIKFALSQNYPNPFNPSTKIEFSIPKLEFVTLKVYNILGEEVATLVSDRLTAGSYSYEWDGSNLASGVYLYRLEAGDFIDSKKMILIK